LAGAHLAIDTAPDQGASITVTATLATAWSENSQS
jgi:hypothetical protein